MRVVFSSQLTSIKKMMTMNFLICQTIPFRQAASGGIYSESMTTENLKYSNEECNVFETR